MNDLRNTFAHSVVLAFIMTVLLPASAVSSSLQKDLVNNQNDITVQPYELFVRSSINGAGGIHEFVNSTTEKAQGISNIDKGKLPTNELFVFNEVRVGFTTGLAVNKAGEALYETKPSKEFRNAEFEIRQGGRLVLNMPVASLCNNYTGTSTDSDFVKLGSLCYLRDDADFTWSFKFPSGVAIPAGGGAADNSYAEVRIRGHRTVRKA
ncbi:MAG: hypothetical protein CL528_00390 [Aequorivita sp.]|jgi:hypothetical protein|nr:hypothetical protein [Aequorivita sp.]|tara:strand:- start:925 stop:1548 length:624 start_codon:yes stop_codon:yes gene_type:complete